MTIQHLRSSTANKRPTPAAMSDGQLAVNTNTASPGLFFKDSAGALIKVGPVHVGTTAPNASPASGGETGNTVGEQWLDTAGGTYVFKVWDGSAWRSESGTFVDVTGDVMTGALVMDNQQQVHFRETTANGTNFIAIQAPASVSADRTLTLPDVTGTLVSTGDTGSVTSTMIADGTIVNADINASAAIAGTKISPDFGSQNVTTTGTSTAASFIPASSAVPTNGVYLPAANSVAISTASEERLRITSAGLVGVGTSSPAKKFEVTNGDIQIQNSDNAAPNTLSSYGLTFRAINQYGQDRGTIAEIKTYLGAGSDNEFGLQFRTQATTAGGVTTKMTLSPAGQLGIGTTSPQYPLDVTGTGNGGVLSDGSIRAYSANRTAYLSVAYNGFDVSTNSGGMVFAVDQSERARIDSSGRLLVGTPFSASTGDAQYARLQVQGNTAASTNGAILALMRQQAATAPLNAGDLLGKIDFTDSAGNTFGTIFCGADGTTAANDYPGRLVFSTTADGASSPTERMRISQSGNLSVGVTSDSGFHELRKSGGSETSAIAGFSTSGSNYPVAIYQVTGAGANGAAAAMLVGRGSVTSRSINAGGTVNASGADYAEYMIKAGDFTIAKGDVCGVTADGQLTNEFADAVSFVVKSTNPSYVGGDTWGSEDVVGAKPEADDADALVQWEADLEAARQAVDRIAFAGQVPVNVMDATPGQYIVPVEAADGGIEGVAKNEADLTLAEYMRAVGKVIAIEDDGRARIIVKVA